MCKKVYRTMTLNDLGFFPELDDYVKENNLSDFSIARVIREHKERYAIKDLEKEYEAEITGNLRFAATSREDYPAVGDWVAFSEFDTNAAIIYHVLPRQTILERQAVGKHGEKQIISTNIDAAFIVQAMDRDFNINRIERYMSLCNNAKIEPVLVMSKIDLISEEELQDRLVEIATRGIKIATLLLSNITENGCNRILEYIEKGKTYCLIGSSGVGKSTLINNLLGDEVLKTSTISDSNNKGRHTTSHRELFVLENGGIIIDTPGMRELGLGDGSDGLSITFENIIALESDCKFSDCTHTHEKGCAILAAVEEGTVDVLSYKNYMKMQREQERFETTVHEKRQKDKDFGKMIKYATNWKNNNKR